MIRVLKTAMRVLGYTYQNVETKLGVAPGYLSRLFRGVIDLRFDHVVDIARAIELEPEEIVQLAFPLAPNPPSKDMRLVTHRLYADGLLNEPPREPTAATAEASIEEETERIERIVLRTFERFFSSMAKSAGGQK